jgi:non-specific serine/threonine protein kinase
MSHPFGDLLSQYRARKHGLSQARLAEAIGYDPSLVGKMCKGGKELTGPSGRDRVVLIVEALRKAGVLVSLAEANALLTAADMPPLYDGLPVEAALIEALQPVVGHQPTFQAQALTHAVTARRTNLPARLTSFIGRENEIAELVERVKATRLLTLTGSGGVGKTRLALEVGAQLLDAFAAGVWVVELAPLSDPALVPQVMASALKLPEQPARPYLDALTAYLEAKHLLLILDNCEHLIDACATLVETLLQRCPNLHVLATSRETLRISGEATHRVPSLTTPADVHVPIDDLLGYESVRLFRERAITSQSKFEWSPSSAVAVSRICSQLDGIPLAIELAASRLNALSAGQIAERLSDRFNLLTLGSRTALLRHQTLRAAIVWSYDLLTKPEQELLNRVSVFAGGFTAEAAEFVAEQPDALTLLSNLVDKSMVIAEVKDGTMRYRLLETIRQFATEMLSQSGEFEPTCQRHLQFFVQLAREAMSHLYTPATTQWSRRMEIEIENVRLALNYAAQRDDISACIYLIEGSCEAWFQRGYVSEGLDRIDRFLLARHNISDAHKVKALDMSAWFLVRMGDIAEAARRFREALDIAYRLDDKLRIFNSSLGLGRASQEYEEALAGIEIAIQVANDALPRWLLTSALIGRGVLARRHGDYDQAEDWLRQSLALCNELNHVTSVAASYHHLAILAYERGNYSDACDAHEACITLERDLGLPLDVAAGLAELAHAALRDGNHERAASAAAEALATFEGIGNEERIAQCLLVFAGLALRHGQAERAIHLLAATVGMREQFAHGVVTQTAFYLEHDRLLNELHDELSQPAFNCAWAEGRAMTLKQAIDYALGEGSTQRIGNE